MFKKNLLYKKFIKLVLPITKTIESFFNFFENWKSNKKKYLRERVYLNLLQKSLITVKSILLFIFIPLMKFEYQKIRENLPNENL